ncbi:hypothetical protein F4804DRAFT_329879 [Jackrogersella minutella]|nr:hypothetical protein F4804DRAFT_329879 [Jackrogersella minutella]
MFRDESSKVIQKAHAQWGSSGSPTDLAGGSASASSSSSSSASAWAQESPGSTLDSSPANTPLPQRDLSPTAIPKKVELNTDQQGMQFYVNRYLMNHPDSPKTRDQVVAYFSSADVAQNVMVAVGLAGMSNLLGNKNMNLVARSKYVAALKQTGQLIARNDPAAFIARLRSVVTLALFEVVQGKGPKGTVGSASTHINGAVAVLRSVLPMPQAPNRGAHGILQLVFSMFIPYHMMDTPLPPAFFETLKFCKHLMHGVPESCSIDLGLAIAQLIQLLKVADRTVLIDGRPGTDNLIQQFIQLDDVFDSLDGRMLEAFPFTQNHGEYPPQAVFRGKWHKYNEVWGARLWNHYRWARILGIQRLVGFITDCPSSSNQVLPPARRARYYATIERLAEDILVSTPSHWHHPMLGREATQKFEAGGFGNSGAVGVPSLLWHLTTAGCAPDVPPEYWEWAYNVLQVVWKQMGMQHAMALSELMEKHRNKLDRETIKQEVKVEREDE